MDNPETLATLATQDEDNTEGNQQWTIQRHWQHWPHKTKIILKAINNGQSRDTGNIATQDEEKQNTKNTTQKNK
jgi:hypothetical protein